MRKESFVAISKIKAKEYPEQPFNPPEIYPEFKEFKLYNIEINKKNEVYSAIRKLFISLKLDYENKNNQKWNPLKDLVKKGGRVVIKPNLVIHNHFLGKKGVESMLTHASVARPIIDYLLKATNGNIKISICDVPLQQANWEKIIEITGLKALKEFYKEKGIDIKLLDLRKDIAITNKEGVIIKRLKNTCGDPLGYKAVNLGKKSYLQDIIKDYKKLEITDYGLGAVAKHHNPEKNEYLIPLTVLNADLFINMQA